MVPGNFVAPGLMYFDLSAERGVLLRPKLTSDAICAEIFRFDISGLNRFNVIRDCLRRRNHRYIGNIFLTPQSPTMKWFFLIQMDCSAEFILCMCGGTNWNATDFCLPKVLSDPEASLSRQCVAGLNPLLASS